MQTIEGFARPGDEISDYIEFLVSNASEKRVAIQAKFNDMVFIVYPWNTYDEIVNVVDGIRKQITLMDEEIEKAEKRRIETIFQEHRIFGSHLKRLKTILLEGKNGWYEAAIDNIGKIEMKIGRKL